MHSHLHSSYSIIDGKARIEDYISLAKLDGQEFLSLTDHGSLGGIIEAYLACKKAGVKFVPGIELYVDAVDLRSSNFPGHLTVLAKNEAGYRSLIAANNLAHRQFYYRPRITLSQIFEHGFAENWVILSGCMSSPIFDYPQADSEVIVRELAKHCANFFLEVQWHKPTNPEFEPKQNEYIERIAALHKSTGFPLLITNDCHFSTESSESLFQELRNKSANKGELEFDGKGFYFKTKAEMEAIANALGCPSAYSNALEIGNLCGVSIPEADKINWYVPDITGGAPKARMIELCEPRLEVIDPDRENGEYWKRYRHELDVLSTSPAILNSYLVTYDLVNWCEERNISCTARGSMGGSLISWLLGITSADPIKWSLSFSRAVNPARPTIPDFDLDVSSRHRPAVLEYLHQRYEGNIPIASYTHYGPKGAIRKILNMEGLRTPPEVNELSKQLPDDWPGDEFPYSARQHKFIPPGYEWLEVVPEQYWDYLSLFKGLYSSMSAHPCGILVSGPERELEHEVPLQWVASSKQLVSAFDMYTLKKLGLFKLDVLGLKTLDQLAYMKAESGAELPDDNYDDPEVLEAFCADLLAEIFQMDGYACREALKQMKGVQHFEDIVAANTLARPGCAQFLPYYRSGYLKLVEEYPPVAETLAMTNGLILYQEQVMEICKILADFDDAEQDDVKESIKYFRHENWKQTVEPLFAQRCQAKGINPENMLSAMADFAGYSYNRSHAMMYAAIAYTMMWYKVKFPAIYYAAVFDAAGDKQRLILESHFFGVEWLAPDINESDIYTKVCGNKILLGLSTIKGVGPSAVEAIMAARPFVSLEDLESRVERRKCNKRVIEFLCDSFALTKIGVPGKIAAFTESIGFSPRYLDTELSQKLIDWQNEVFPNRVAGFVTELRSLTIRKPGKNEGKEMGRISVVNMNGKKTCIAFPEIWRKVRANIYQGSPIKFYGESNLQNDFIIQDCEEVLD